LHKYNEPKDLTSQARRTQLTAQALLKAKVFRLLLKCWQTQQVEILAKHKILTFPCANLMWPVRGPAGDLPYDLLDSHFLCFMESPEMVFEEKGMLMLQLTKQVTDLPRGVQLDSIIS
jgi:hypothetical protein